MLRLSRKPLGQKTKRFRSQVYLAFVRTFPCVKCEAPGPDAHHITYAMGVKARSLKVGDDFTIPLCRTCHDALHRFGDERLWWAILGRDPLAWASDTYHSWAKDNP